MDATLDIPRYPRPEDWAEAARNSHLDPEKSDAVLQVVTKAVDEIRAAQARELAAPSRSERLAAIRRLSSALEALTGEVARSAPMVQGLLRSEVYPDLGRLMSCGGMSRILRESVGGVFHSQVEEGPSYRTPIRQPIRGRQAVDAEAQSLSPRVNVATARGADLLAGFASILRQPLETELALERLNRGGRPPKRMRNTLLFRLALAHEPIFGRRATISEPFVTLCEQVATAVGFDDLGVDKAVPRILDEIRKLGNAGP